MSQEIKKIPERVRVFDFVPQITVLQDTYLFITHGGINSLKEAIYMTVPLLVYPINLDWDQVGNAARVEYHNIGLRGNLKKVNSKELMIKIKTLIEDHAKFKQNIEKLKKDDDTYTKAGFLKTFYGLIKDNES